MQELNNPDPVVERALIIAPSKTTQHPIQYSLEQAGWQVEVCDGQDKPGSMRNKSFRLLIVVTPGADSDSLPDTLQSLRPFTANEGAFVIVIAINPSISDAILSIRLG